MKNRDVFHEPPGMGSRRVLIPDPAVAGFLSEWRYYLNFSEPSFETALRTSSGRTETTYFFPNGTTLETTPLHIPKQKPIIINTHPLIGAPKTMLKIAETAALKAGKIILQSLERLNTVKVTEKGQKDYVTDIDRKSEESIIQILQKTYPDHKILAEESGELEGNEDNLWIIDPLDGTKNFMHGYPHFCVSIAYQERGILQVGVIYDPLRDELFTASRGNGAHVNNKRLRVSQQSKLEDALIGTGFQAKHAEHFESHFQCYKALFPNISGMRRSGSAALDLAYVAAGRLDGFWELMLSKWDIAAGILMIREAGGLVSDPQGTEDYLESGSIIAGSPKIFKAMLQIISTHLNPGK